jgi:hypothetical protein
VQDVTTTSHAVATALQNLTLHYWRVTPNNFCGTGSASATFSFTTRGAPRILLVDDDDNAPDVRSYYTGVLTALGYTYDVWDTLNSDNEPDATALAPYTSVIWFTGDSLGGFAGPGASGEAAISSYLDNGPHCFLISSQDYHADRGQTPLMTNYLGANFVVENVGHTTVRGQGLFSGLGPYTLTYPFTNRSDRVNPIRGSSDPAFKGRKFAGVTKLTSAYLTGFLGFPIEAIATDANRQAVIGRFLEQTICN